MIWEPELQPSGIFSLASVNSVFPLPIDCLAELNRR